MKRMNGRQKIRHNRRSQRGFRLYTHRIHHAHIMSESEQVADATEHQVHAVAAGPFLDVRDEIMRAKHMLVRRFSR